MLTMIAELPEKKRGRIGKIWRGLVRPKVNARVCRCGHTAHVVIYYEKAQREPDWRMVEAYSLEPSRRVLAPIGFSFPQECGLRRFVPNVFSRRMLENLALETLVCCPEPPSRRSAALIGREDEIICLLPRIAPLVGELRIITRRPYAVAEHAGRMTANSGQPVIVTDELDAGDCGVIIAPSGGTSVIRMRQDSVVFSPETPLTEEGLWITGAEIGLPSVLEEIYSDRYDLTEFVGAFYELAGMRELGQLCPDAGLTRSGRMTPEEIGNAMSGVSV